MKAPSPTNLQTRPSVQRFKLKRVKNPDKYYTRVPASLGPDRVLAHGTVGAVALDADGLLAAASSSSGASGKTTGRIGESAVIGAGVWADSRVAVSCAGVGEYFQRVAAASVCAWSHRGRTPTPLLRRACRHLCTPP